MKEKIYNVLIYIIIGIGLICAALYALAAQPTKSWENFPINIGVEIGIIILVSLLVKFLTYLRDK
jgi:hypothetical protein